MKNNLASFLALIETKSGDLLASLALIFIGYAFYNPALRFVPVDFDDLVLLSSVKKIGNPLEFFTRDWGFGNYGYRPLHSISLWFGYKLFGVSAGPNQLVNVLLHIFVILLLYTLLARLQQNRLLAFLFSCLSLVSFYTLSPATWVSDRPTLLVAFFLLIALNYLCRLPQERQPSLLLLGGLSTLALLSKESGLLVPLAIIFFLMVAAQKSAGRTRTFLFLLALITIYFLFRFFLFGSQAGTYEESGYLFGFRYYSNSGVLSGEEAILARVDNVVKNMIAIFLPIFDGQGKLSPIGSWSNTVILLSTTLLLIILSTGRKLSAWQKIGLAIILLNALVHFQVFRYRTLYLAQIGLSIFLAASPLNVRNQNFRSALITAAAALLFLWNINIIGEDLTYQYLARVDRIRMESFESDILTSSSQIDPDIIKNIISKYRH